MVVRMLIVSLVAPRGSRCHPTQHGSGLGKFRWFIERTLSWFKQFRRLRIRYERRAGFYYAFWKLASAIICFRILTSGFS